MADETILQPTKLVPLVWGDVGVTIFANHAAVQFDGKSVFVTFGQAVPPVILGETDEEKQTQLDKVQSITIRPVVRLAMAPEDFRAVVQVFQKHLALVDEMDKREPE